MELKMNSWHYYIASEIGGFDDDIDGFYYSTDDEGNTQINVPVCPYIKSILLGIILSLFIAFICGVILYSIGYTLGWIGVSLYDGIFTEPNTPFIFIGAITIISIILGFIERLIKIIIWKIQTKDHHTPKKSSFISAAYKSFKDKFCFYITLK